MPARTPLADLEWVVSFPLLTSRYILWDLLKVLLWTGSLFSGLLAVMVVITGGAGSFPWTEGARAIALGLAGVAALFGLVALVFFGNRYQASLRVSARGVYFESLERRGALINRLAILFGLLGGNPGLAGAGLLASSRASEFFPWTEIRRVRDHSRDHVISLCNSWRVLVRLYCTPENYEQVRAAVRGRLRSGAVWR